MEFIEIAKIVNTHGIRGEIKLLPLCNDAEMILEFDELFLDDKCIKIKSSRIHKNSVLMKIDGLDDINDAEKLKNKILYADKSMIDLEENVNFISDIIGCSVFDKTTNQDIGEVIEVLSPPSHDIYVIKNGEKQILIPVVSQFVLSVDIIAKKIIIATIDGML